MKNRIKRPALLFITIIFLLSFVLTGCSGNGYVNYYDLGSIFDYIEMEESDYKNYDIEISVPEIGESDVDNAVLQVLKEHRGKLKYDGKYVLNIPLAAGDDTYIWYRGYEINDKGEKVELKGTSNFEDSSPTMLTLGSGQFAAGFELGLVGKCANDTRSDDNSSFSIVNRGVPLDGDVVYLTVSYVEETGSTIHTEETIRLDLRDPYLEDRWGDGIRDIVLDMTIGLSEFDARYLTKANGENITYTYMKINYVTRCEDNPITVKTLFPHDYSEESFRNKTVYFDVYIEHSVHYETAVLDEALIKEKLKLTEETLSAYEGETLVERYRSYLKSSLVRERELARRYAAEDEIWAHLKKNVVIKSLPEKEIRRLYDLRFRDFEEEYVGLTTMYDSIDTYINEYYGLGEGGNWQLMLTEEVKDEITEKMILFAFLHMEGLMPTEEQFSDIYQAELELDFEYYGKTRKDFATEEEYIKALEEYEADILEYYGEEFYKETVYYNYATGKMLELVNIKTK